MGVILQSFESGFESAGTPSMRYEMSRVYIAATPRIQSVEVMVG